MTEITATGYTEKQNKSKLLTSLKRLWRNPTTLIGFILVFLFIIIALFGPMLAPLHIYRTKYSK
jgi:ABC-type antimicrobial peptide transport system permease subunit